MNEQNTPKWEQAIQEKHRMQMEAHQQQFGRLGDLQLYPTREDLDQEFEDRRAKGELFTQQKEN